MIGLGIGLGRVGAISPDNRAEAYIAAAGVADPDKQARVRTFFRKLRSFGNSFLDGACFVSGFNTESGNLVSLVGSTIQATGNPVRGRCALHFDGVDDALWQATRGHAGPYTLLNFRSGSSDVATGCYSFCWQAGDIHSPASAARTSVMLEHGTTNALQYGTHYNGVSAIVTGFIGGSAQPVTIPWTGTDDNSGSAGQLKMKRTPDSSWTSSTGGRIATPLKNRISIGARSNDGGASFTSIVKGAYGGYLLFDRVLTDAEVLAIHDLANNTLWKRTNLIVVGDSISTSATDKWPYRLFQRSNWWGVNALYTNTSVDGRSTQVALTNISSEVLSRYVPGAPNVVLCQLGLNDFSNSKETIIARLRSYWSQCKTAGFKVYQGTITRASSVVPSAETAWNWVNDEIRASVALGQIDGVVDVHAELVDAIGPDYNENTSYWSVDKVHPGNAGYALIADIYNDAISPEI